MSINEIDISKSAIDFEWYSKNLLCESSCLLDIRIEKIIDYIENNQFSKAVMTMYESNPFPSITGRLCRCPCEEGCNRNKSDGTVKIQNIERFIGDYALDKDIIPELNDTKGKRVCIIGAGLTGLSTAFFLRRIGFDVDVYEKESYAWGNLRLIPEFELERKILDKELNKLERMGIKINLNKKLEWQEINNVYSKKYDAVIIANGRNLSKNNISRMKGIVDAISMFKEYSETPESEITFGKKLIIIGINEIALLAGRLAIRNGASAVEMYYKDTKNKIKTADNYLRKARQEGIRMNYYIAFKDIISANSDSNKPNKVELVKTKVGVRDEELTAIKGTEFIIEADTVIYADYDDDYLERYSHNKLDNKNEKALNNFTVGNVFNYDDVLIRDFNVLDIIENAKSLAGRVYSYIFNEKADALEGFSKYSENETLSIGKALIDGKNAESKPAVRRNELSLAERVATNSPVIKTYTIDEVKEECSRCLRCSHFIEINNINLCISCGICMDICPMDCISLTNIVHPYLKYGLKTQPEFINKLFGLEDISIKENYVTEFQAYLSKPLQCIRCLECVNNCPVNIIEVKKAVID